MDDEFDVGDVTALPVSETVSEDNPAAIGGLDGDEHVSMRGELWSDEDESFEDSEAGEQGLPPQAALPCAGCCTSGEALSLTRHGIAAFLSMLHQCRGRGG